MKPITTPVKIVNKMFNNFVLEESGYDVELFLDPFLAIATILYNMFCVYEKKIKNVWK
jgi:hypothetical protein